MYEKYQKYKKPKSKYSEFVAWNNIKSKYTPIIEPDYIEKNTHLTLVNIDQNEILEKKT